MSSATESPEGSSDAAPIDQSVLDVLVEEVADGDPAILVDLIDSYLDEATGQVAQIESAIQAGDAATVAAVTHSLKSASAVLGAVRFADLLKRTELLARAESPEYAGQAGPIREEFGRVAEAMQALRPGD